MRCDLVVLSGVLVKLFLRYNNSNLLVTPDSGVIDPLLQGPLEMWHTLRTTSKPHLLAKVIPPFPTDLTLTTRNADFESDSVSDREAIDLWSNAHHHSRSLMSKRKRSTSAQVAIGEFFVVAYIGATDTRRFNLDLQLARKRFGNAAYFLDLGVSGLSFIYHSSEKWDGFLLPISRRGSHATRCCR
jgi:hypothetical protein